MSWPDKVEYAKDANGNVIGLVAPDGKMASQFSFPSLTPYKLAFWGDSRYNAFTGSTVETIGSGTLFSTYRLPTWIIAYMQDAEFASSYAVSGDTAVSWNSAARTGGKTFIALNAGNEDAVFVQYGINDILAGTATATIIAALQKLCVEIIKGGKFCIFESILPINSPATSHATNQPRIDTVNAAMQTWIADTYPYHALYIDTATSIKGSDGYANYEYISSADGIHQTNIGAKLEGEILAREVRALLPKRIGVFWGNGREDNNLINQTSPSPIATQFNSVDSGTVGISQSQGSDADGFYYEWTLTPTVVGASGCWQVRLESAANFQTASPPYVSLLGNEVLQGSARIYVDDGANGAASGLKLFELRQRFYTAAIFADWCGLITSLNPVLDKDIGDVVDVYVHTPRLRNTAASVVATPSGGSGLVLATFVQGTSTSGTVRVRVYNPQIRIVGYYTPIAVTPSGSPYTYTNTTLGTQIIYIAGGTVSGITHNGVATGQTAGIFTLSPNDVIVVTYSVAPTTFSVKQS